MPLNKKGKKIMKSMKDQYGEKEGKAVFYASKNKGTISGVEKKVTKAAMGRAMFSQTISKAPGKAQREEKESTINDAKETLEDLNSKLEANLKE